MKTIFLSLIGPYAHLPAVQETYWQELVIAYSHQARHYHTMHHLEYMLLKLQQLGKSINNWEPVLWSLFYHDYVYKITSAKNEEKSALKAAQVMHDLGVPATIIEKSRQYILATKKHLSLKDNDGDYLLDADIAILGETPVLYNEYTAAMREEYRFFPDIMYNPARAGILRRFLEKPVLYHTPEFAAIYEEQARINIRTELTTLGKL